MANIIGKHQKHAWFTIHQVVTTYRRNGSTPLTGPGWLGTVIRRDILPERVRLVSREVDLFGIRYALRLEQQRRGLLNACREDDAS